MSELELKSFRFRAEREDDWKQLENLIARIENGSIKDLSDSELLALPGLYRSALSSLSVARETSLDQGVVDYLQSLSTRAYYNVYGTRTRLSQRFMQFLRHDWPAAMRAIWKETLVAAFVFFFAAFVAYFMVMNDMDWYNNFMPGGMAGDRTPAASTQQLKCTLYTNLEECGESHGGGLTVFASSLFSNNAGVALFAFALGFAFGIPTIALLMYNGFTIGAFFALFKSRDLGFEVFGWLAIHGTTEIFAIILAGAAGLHIGKAVAFPGEKSRLSSASAAGPTAATAAFGVVIMLFIAALLEGYGRQLINSDLIRYGFCAISIIIWGLYYYAPRRRNIELPETVNV